MKRLSALFLFCAAASVLFAAPPPATGSVYCSDALASQTNWQRAPFARFSAGTLTVTAGQQETGADDGKAVGVRDVFGNLEKAKQKVFVITRGLDLSKLRGCEVELSVQVKADTKQPPLPWEGVRIVLNYATPMSAYSDCGYNLWGTFGWKTVRFRGRIPSDLTNASLTLGLIADTGSAEFRSLKLTVTDPPRTPGCAPVSAEPYTGRTDGTPLRGFNTCGNILGGLLARYAGEWNANLFKMAFRMPPPEPEDAFEAALEKQFAQWDQFIEEAKAKKVSVILEVYPSKWRDKNDKLGNTDFFYYRPGCAEKLVRLWERIAERYKGNKTVYAFELLNESELRIQPAPGMPDYPELMDRVAQAINRIDPERTVLVQPEEWWGARAFEKLRPIKAKNVVYALHFYMPFALTHQDLAGKGDTPYFYPGEIKGKRWDKEALRRELQPVIEFQKAYNVHILVSEFSCIRWSPGADRWINDAIELFEEQGWDWTFHAVAEWPGWSPEFGPDPANTTKDVPNAEKEVLLKFLQKNRKRD